MIVCLADRATSVRRAWPVGELRAQYGENLTSQTLQVGWIHGPSASRDSSRRTHHVTQRGNGRGNNGDGLICAIFARLQNSEN
jgi:hypothetical protein